MLIRPKEIVVVLIMFTLLILSIYRFAGYFTHIIHFIHMHLREGIIFAGSFNSGKRTIMIMLDTSPIITQGRQDSFI